MSMRRAFDASTVPGDFVVSLQFDLARRHRNARIFQTSS